MADDSRVIAKRDAQIAVCTRYQTDLNTFLADPVANAQKITVTRGRYIRSLVKLLNRYEDKLDPAAIGPYRTELNTQLAAHRQQILTRINTNKKAPKYNVPEEIVLKMRKTAGTFKKIFAGKGFVETGKAIVNTTFGTISTALSVAKWPLQLAVFATKTVGYYGGSLVGYAVSLPVETCHYLFGKLVDPETTWDWEITKKMGGTLGSIVEDTIGLVGDTVLRM